jgi:peptidyl-prolyl cis-trans isomerase A (cyclophilin A)
MIHAAMPLILLALQAPVAASHPAPEATPTPFPGPVVVLDTSLGKIRIGLDKAKAPVTVDNFLKYARGGHYDGTIFHRVIPGFMIQGGGMDPDMTERPTRPPIKNEANNGLRNKRGSVAMARTNDADSATSQFFVNVKDNLRLDYGVAGAGYAVFGEVLSGMDVVDKIVNVPRGNKGAHGDVPLTPVIIKTVREASAARPAAKPAPAAKPVTTP